MTDRTTTEPKAGPPVSDAAFVRVVPVAPADRSPQQRRVLHIFLWINLAMFLAELVAGLLAVLAGGAH